MSAAQSLSERLEAEFAAADDRERQYMAQKEEEFQGRQQRLDQFEKLLRELPGIWRPPLEALAAKFGERVEVKPKIEPDKRSATFDFQSELASIKLRFSAAPDPDVRNLVVTYDLEILPILMKFDKHRDIEFPLDAVDKAALATWFDDRIIDFVRTYFALHENQYYLKDHLVEDPIAKVRFPKYAAGATCEQGGKTHYFLNESTCREFQEKQSPAAKT